MATRRPDRAELVEALAAVGDWLDGRGEQPERSTLARAVRVSTRALAAQARGSAVELRVPPFAAVQCVTGPRHVRGTPPNVVETDPHTWLAIATGRLSWDGALRSGRLAVSGIRAAELRWWLPVDHRLH